jgi:hypothetical protein
MLARCGGVGVTGVGGTQAGSNAQILQLAASPPSVAFGNVKAGTTGTQDVSVTDVGTGNIVISQTSVSGSGFSVSGLALRATLSPGQTARFAAQFSPPTAGNATGSVSVVSNASNSPLAIALSGTGFTQTISASATNLNFANVLANTSSAQSITVTNTGSASVAISQATATGSGFSLSAPALPLTLSPGQTATFTVHFSPSSDGSSTGSIALESNASSSPLVISISGNEATQGLSVSPSSLSFGNVLVNTKSTLPVVITNTGSANTTISQTTTTGVGFSVSSSPLPLTLAAGQNASLSVAFDPTAAGSVTGGLSIVSSAGASPKLVPLSGTAVNQHSVTLRWVPSTSPNIQGYNVYRGTVSGGPYTQINSSLVTGTTYSDATVEAGETYFYVTTAINSQGTDSAYSNQASVVIPSP